MLDKINRVAEIAATNVSRREFLSQTANGRNIMQRITCLKCSVALAAAVCVGAIMSATPASAARASRISGVGYFDESDVCDSGSVGADFALIMTGDLEGCLYVFVETSSFTPSGTYMETGTELFVGADGSFETAYRFEAKYEDPANLIGEIFGRCQHIIVQDSGTGDFDGVGGRIDFKDDIEAGDFPYQGSLQFAH